MGALIWIGAVISLIGVGLLIYCILGAFKLRQNPGDDEATKSRLQKLAAVNMAALGISAIGLMMVILGITFT